MFPAVFNHCHNFSLSCCPWEAWEKAAFLTPSSILMTLGKLGSKGCYLWSLYHLTFKWKRKVDVSIETIFPFCLANEVGSCVLDSWHLLPSKQVTQWTSHWCKTAITWGLRASLGAEQTMLSPLHQGNNSPPHHAPSRCFDSHRRSPHSCSSFWEDLHNLHRGSWLAALSLKCPVLPYRRKLQSCSLKGVFPLTSMPTATFGALRPASACFLAALSLQLLLWSAAAFGEHPGALLSCTGKQQLLQLRQA